MRREQFLGALLFGAGALTAALVAWAILGRHTEAVVLRALACATMAGILIGGLAPRWVRSHEPRDAARAGLLVGLLVHPATWLLFVLWGYLIPTSDKAVGGSLLQAAENVVLWTAASIPHGAALTLPISIGAAFIYQRMVLGPRS